MNFLTHLLPLLRFSFASDPPTQVPLLQDEDVFIPMDNFLFPNNHSYKLAWTTSPLVSLSEVEFVDLSDEALGVHRIDRRRPQIEVVPAPHSPAGALHRAWLSSYPKGSINPNGDIPGGVGFYLSGPNRFRERLVDAKEVIFGYSVLFESDWEWVKGGKLPGIFGGAGTFAYSCTGGRKNDRDKCFNFRLMWRESGAGELYAYIPYSAENQLRLVEVPPKSFINPDYGASVGRGSFKFKAGEWVTVTERVKLNTEGAHNGEIEVRINGRTTILVSGIMLRTCVECAVQGLHFESFFGGHTQEWACPKDQQAWFSDISGAIIE